MVRSAEAAGAAARPPTAVAGGARVLWLGAALLLIAGVGALASRDVSAPEDAGRRAVTVLLVDTSASVVRTRDDAPRRMVRAVREGARAARERGHDLALVTFDVAPALRHGPADPRDFEDVLRASGAQWFQRAADGGGPASDLAAAVRLAARVMADVPPGGDGGPRPPGTLVVMGDGESTGEDPARALAHPAIGTVIWSAPGPVARHDLVTLALRAPDPVPADVAPRIQADLALGGSLPPDRREGLAVRFDWSYASTRSSGAGLGPGRFEESGVTVVPLGAELAGRATARRDGPLRFTLEWLLPARPAGLADLVASATLVDGRSPLARAAAGTIQLPEDAFPSNDRSAVRWRIGDPVRVAVCAPGEEALAEAMAVLRRAGFGVAAPLGDTGRGLDFFPVPLAELGPLLRGEGGIDVDALLTMDTPLSALPATELGAFVERRGGGWIHAAGWPRLRGDGGELERLLALEPDRPPREPLRVHFLADGSGSMAGERWRRTQAALGRLIPSVSPGDELRVRFFTQVLHRVGVTLDSREGEDPATARARRAEALRDLGRTTIPGGSTDITGSVNMLCDAIDAEVRADDPRRNLIVLLTDGLSNASGTPAALVRAHLDASGIDAVAIHVGTEGGDVPLGGASGPSPGEMRSARRLLEAICGGPDRVTPAGELGDVYSLLQQAIEGADPVRDGEVSWTAGGEAPGLAEPARQAVARAGALLTSWGTLTADRVLPARAAPGAVVLARATEPERPAGDDEGAGGAPEPGAPRSTVLAALAPRGAGLTLGLAVGMGTARDLGEEPWAPEVSRRLGWWTPILREMAARRRASGAANDDRGGVALEPHPLGGEPWLVLRTPSAALPALVRGEIRRPGAVDAFGASRPGERLGTVELGIAPAALGDGASTRAVRRPAFLDAVTRGTPLELRLEGRAGGPPALRFTADGPLESQALIRPRPVPPAPAGSAPGGRGDRDIAPPGPRPGPGLMSLFLTLVAAAGGLLVAFGALPRRDPARSEGRQ